MTGVISWFVKSVLIYLGLRSNSPSISLVPPLIPRDVIYGNPNRTSVTISTDGRHIAFLAPVDSVMNIWIQDVNSEDWTPRPVTFLGGRGILNYAWSFQENTIIYSQDENGDENSRLYTLDISTLATRRLTETNGVQAVVVASSYRFPDLLVVALNDRDPRFHDLHQLNITTGERNLIFRNEDGFKDFVFDNDMNLRLAAAEAEDGGTRWFRNSEEYEGWRSYRNLSLVDDYATKIEGFSKDNTQVYWSETVNRNLAALVLKDFEEPKSRGQMIYEPEKSDIEGIIFHPTKYIPLALYEHYMKPELKILNRNSGNSIAEDLGILHGLDPDRIPFILSSNVNFDRWIVRMGSDSAPSNYYLYDVQNKIARYLFQSREDYNNYDLTKLHMVEIETRDGLNQVCYLGLPIEHSPKEGFVPKSPIPMILKVHGGPWHRDKWAFDPDTQFWTNRGYAVLRCNFRGSTGYGKEFYEASFGEWGRKMQHDLTDAVNWAIEQGIAEESKIAILGASYGGYAALAGLAFTPDLFACGIDAFGPSNLVTYMNALPLYLEPIFNSSVRMMGGNPRSDEGRQFLLERSPISYAHQITKPLLIGQGSNDPRVNQVESDQIAGKLKENGIPVTYLLFPDEGHSFYKPENSQLFQAVSEQFFHKCLGGRYEPITNEFENSGVIVVDKGSLDI